MNYPKVRVAPMVTPEQFRRFDPMVAEEAIEELRQKRDLDETSAVSVAEWATVCPLSLLLPLAAKSNRPIRAVRAAIETVRRRAVRRPELLETAEIAEKIAHLEPGGDVEGDVLHAMRICSRALWRIRGDEGRQAREDFLSLIGEDHRLVNLHDWD